MLLMSAYPTSQTNQFEVNIMRTSPTPSELAMFDDLTPIERFDYATIRMAECEDVWSIGSDEGFAIEEKEGKPYIVVWPYQQLAQNYCVDEHEDKQPLTISLEMFVYNLLMQCQEEGIAIQIFPQPSNEGRWISAVDLFSYMEGLMESGEYYMEG